MPSPCTSDGPVVETVRFAAGPYLLEGELAYPEWDPPVAAALLVGPHPLLGGDMRNNVVRGLGDGLARRGFVTLRFNYHGAGRGEGPAADVAANLARFWETSHVPDEAEHRDDLRAALDLLRAVAGPGLTPALVGYSYGCSLLPAVARGDRAASVLIAPTVGSHDYEGFAEVAGPKLVIASEGDFAADAARLARWFDGLPEPKRLVRPRLDGHFFRGHEDWLTALVASFIDSHGS
jgi:alpha/beta superfamily hydrolase